MAQLLESQGWSVLSRNWRGGGGEIDLVAFRGDELRFVEVKARSEGDDSGLESVTTSKQQRLVRAAEAWWQEHRLPAVRRQAFSVAVVAISEAQPWRVDWFDDAFDGC